MRRWARTVTTAFAAVTALGACVAPLPEGSEPAPGELAVGETRELELRYLRFEVEGFEKTLRRADIAALPEDIKERLWLLDLDLSRGPNTPQLLDNALAQVKELPPESLSPPARNLQALLRMTPATARLEGTSLEELVRLAPLIGVAPERCLSDLLSIDVDAEFLSPAVVAETLLEQVIRSHPRARQRLGPRTAERPDGLYPVAPAGLPVSLADAVTDFATLPRKFGVYVGEGVYHPGFLGGESRARVLGDNFALTVRANANALPYKGVDLSRGAEASVGSIASQIQQLFDFSDPAWLTLEGLTPGVPTLETITFRIQEDARFVPGGRSPLPAGLGSSPVWQMAPWSLERVLAEASRRAYAQQTTTVAYGPPGRPKPLFSANVAAGFQTIEVDGGLGSPPPPSYLWDVLLEVGQVRLHDGGIPEGEASVELTLRDVPIGIDSATLAQTIRENLQADPQSLLGIASTLVDGTVGEADLYYLRDRAEGTGGEAKDWLFFIGEEDLRSADPAKEPGAVASRRYAVRGFFADEALQQKVSSTRAVAGDTTHEKVEVTPGTVLYSADDKGAVFRITIGPKARASRLNLSITRIR